MALNEAVDSPGDNGSTGSGGSGTGSGSSDTHKPEFSQVKLLAQNKIVLSQVLSDEQDQVSNNVVYIHNTCTHHYLLPTFFSW